MVTILTVLIIAGAILLIASPFFVKIGNGIEKIGKIFKKPNINDFKGDNNNEL